MQNYDRDIGEIFATLKAILGGIDDLKKVNAGTEARLRVLEDFKSRVIGALSLLTVAEVAVNVYLLTKGT